MNSKCFSAFVVHCAGNSPKQVIVLESTYHTEKSGTNTVSVVYRRIRRLEHKWQRLSSCHGLIGLDQFRGLFFFLLLLGVTPFLTISFGSMGFGLNPSFPSFHAWRRSRGVRGAKYSGFGGSCRYILLMSGASTVPRSVRPLPVWIARMRQVWPSKSMRKPAV